MMITENLYIPALLCLGLFSAGEAFANFVGGWNSVVFVAEVSDTVNTNYLVCLKTGS